MIRMEAYYSVYHNSGSFCALQQFRNKIKHVGSLIPMQCVDTTKFLK